jgi:hypothetical protein
MNICAWFGLEDTDICPIKTGAGLTTSGVGLLTTGIALGSVHAPL